nr:MAG: hypothetical protein [uncultured archaeon]
MDIRNYFLKKRQLKAMDKKNYIGDINYYNQLPYHCPKCHWRTDELTAYTTHLENHLIKKRKKT